MEIPEVLYQVLGWAGMFLIVGAYFLSVTKRLDANDNAYLLMNITGSVGVGINAYHQEAWPAFALQIVWILITLWVMYRKLTAAK